MQSQVVSGVPPLSPSLFLLSSTKRLPPHLSISPSSCFSFTLLVWVFIFIISLAFYLASHPSSRSLSWYFSWLLREGFLLEASSCWQRRGRFTVGSRRSRRCTTPWDSLLWNGGILNSFNALFGDYLLCTSSSHLTLGYNRRVQKKSNVCSEAFCMFDV